ncbi:hypothetical protein DFP72DRAFT_860513 [Ephemerocybe angulata]|uniref:Uncharacterized protein n=1 Tax=Ephemerocybe angulata TaxID=980116 RepID=A0A8H6H8K8_9AGAR|nr:hypothetical protein DFP72DRAFT_860513 [Tulosesus angulatus]
MDSDRVAWTRFRSIRVWSSRYVWYTKEDGWVIRTMETGQGTELRGEARRFRGLDRVVERENRTRGTSQVESSHRRFGIYDDYKRHKRNNHKPPSNAERETEDRVGTKGVLNTRGSWFSEGEVLPFLEASFSGPFYEAPGVTRTLLEVTEMSRLRDSRYLGLAPLVPSVIVLVSGCTRRSLAFEGRERLVTGFRSYPEGRARCGGTRRHEEEPESRSEANTREISRLRLRSYHLPHTLNLDCPQSVCMVASRLILRSMARCQCSGHRIDSSDVREGEYDSGPGSRASTSIPSARLHPSSLAPTSPRTTSRSTEIILKRSSTPFFKGMDNAQIAAKLVELKYLYKVEVFIIHGEGSPYWLGNPSLGIKCSKLQSMLAILAKCTKPGETPLVDPSSEGKMLPGDMAVSTWRDGKSGASGGAGASRGTKRPLTPAVGSAAQNWRTPTQGPPNFYGVMRRTRELISTGDAESDGPEARILGGVMAIRTQMFGLESQIDVMQELWVGLGQQHDAKVEDLRNHLKDYEPLAPRIAPAHTVLPDDRSHVSRSAVAPTRRHELAEDRVVVNLRGTTRGSSSQGASCTPFSHHQGPWYSRRVAVEVPVASSSRDKGKARANPVRSTRAKKTWAEEVEAEDVRMVVSEGDVSEENEEDEIESGDESDLSELPKGYRSD